MRFSRGDWTHEGFMDVFFQITKVQYSDAKRVKVRGHWWNLGWTGNPFKPFNEQLFTLEIKASEFPRWKRLESRIRTVPETA
jgi:hypothetical protein